MKQAAQFRITENEDDYWIEDYWKAAIEIFTKDCAKTINSFKKIAHMKNFIGFRKFLKKLRKKHKVKSLFPLGVPDLQWLGQKATANKIFIQKRCSMLIILNMSEA